MTIQERCENIICDNKATRIIHGDKLVDGKWVGVIELRVCASCCVRVAEKLQNVGYVTSIGNI